MLIENNDIAVVKKNTQVVLNSEIIDFSDPMVMGILNVTKNSFFDGGRYIRDFDISEQAEKMISEGAAIIDVGACSTRPGSLAPDIEDEYLSLKKAIQNIRKVSSNIPISIDTYRSEIVERIFKDFGHCIVNDISAGELDSKMFETIAKYNVPYIIMHMQGTPENMQKNPKYNDLIKEIIRYFSLKINELQNLGVSDIIIDPGFGFGKTIGHNFELLNKLDSFKVFSQAVLVGLSRKSMIFKSLDTSAKESLNGTTALNMAALIGGASVLRVHDVREAMETISLFNKLRN